MKMTDAQFLKLCYRVYESMDSPLYQVFKKELDEYIGDFKILYDEDDIAEFAWKIEDGDFVCRILLNKEYFEEYDNQVDMYMSLREAFRHEIRHFLQKLYLMWYYEDCFEDLELAVQELSELFYQDLESDARPKSDSIHNDTFKSYLDSMLDITEKMDDYIDKVEEDYLLWSYIWYPKVDGE